MNIEEVRIKHHGRESYGMYYKPDASDKHPMIIFSHGYNGNWRGADKYARYFADKGVGCFCHDFCGGSTTSESSMQTTEMTVFTERDDLLAIFEAICEWKDVNRDNIYLFGDSQGGFVSALAAEILKERLKGLFMLFPALCIPDDWRRRCPDKKTIPDQLEFWGMKLGRRYIEEVVEFDVFNNLGKYKGPVQIVHGSMDEVVPVSYSDEAVELYNNAELTVLEGEGHGFSEQGCDLVIHRLCDFISQ